MRARVIVVALLAWGSGLPGLVGAEPLVEIKHFAICRFYFREVDTAVSKVYVANVDAIDVSQFVPADGDRRVSRTPVISWDVADGGALYYVLRIWRDGRLVLLDDVFENGTGLDKSSFAVPFGVLERGTRYGWTVEACDSDVLEDINHCGLLPMLHFQTAR